MRIIDDLGWRKETHTILGKQEVRYHKDGFEIPEYLMNQIIDYLTI